MTLCAECTKADGCSKDADAQTFKVPTGSCFSPLQEFPDDGEVWGEFDVLDECNRGFLIRTFYSSNDGSCVNATDSYKLEYDTCLGPFGEPRPWGVFTCDDTTTQFDDYLSSFDISIPTFEYATRLSIFNANIDLIDSHNELYESGKKTFSLKLNKFAHLTDDEFKAAYTTFSGEVPAVSTSTKSSLSSRDEPIDWVIKGAVTPIGDEAACIGACWAFAASSAIESARFINTGSLSLLSTQQLVNCVYPNLDSCSRGGDMDAAFEWVKKNGGLCSAEDWSYDGTAEHQGPCTNSCMSASHSEVASVVKVPQSEQALIEAIAKQPVVAAIQGLKGPFKFYESGVLTGECGNDLDHGVLVVGWGVDEETGVEYWKIKNDFGRSWGEEGYVRLEKGGGKGLGMCGLYMSLSYPVLA